MLKFLKQRESRKSSKIKQENSPAVTVWVVEENREWSVEKQLQLTVSLHCSADRPPPAVAEPVAGRCSNNKRR